MTENVKCPECKLVNWGTAQNCRRCSASLAEIPFTHTSINQNQAGKVTVANEDHVKTEFQTKRIRQLLLGLPIILLLLAYFLLGGTTLFILFFLVVIGALIFSYFNWQCPSCNAFLGLNVNPSACPNCGATLR